MRMGLKQLTVTELAVEEQAGYGMENKCKLESVAPLCVSISTSNSLQRTKAHSLLLILS